MRIFCATRAKTGLNTAGILYKKDTALQMRAPGSSRETGPDEQSVASRALQAKPAFRLLRFRFWSASVACGCFRLAKFYVDDRACYHAREAHYWMFVIANRGFQSLVAAVVRIVHQVQELGADLI